ncbi:uncharacterized protein TNCV_3992131 [Trichonephila clavipes]|uniref:Retrotransposon gag domain-containing protein n=1 Tax=Trichonephila clavipes TaxID=2585209 RepID=A0A8X6VP69_TRICX|nr:uncharacterized protein TNCV_3992131 [Trichonephila clavipes]
MRLLEIPSDLSYAYLKGHLLGRVQDWYKIFGSAFVPKSATDFAQLKATLSKAFLAIRNKKDLEIKFYASQQRRDQEPTDFVYDLLKLNKKLDLRMSEKALVDHIFVILEPKVQDYVEVRNPENTVQLRDVFSKFEKDIHANQCGVRVIVIMLKDEVGMCVECVMVMIGEEIGEIRKLCVDRVMADMIIGVTTRMDVKEISASTTRIDF